MKRFFSAILLILLLSGAACAWEFAINGVQETRFTYLSSFGNGDLFGNRTVAQTNAATGAGGGGAGAAFISTIGLSGPYFGVVSPEVLSVKGSDTAWEDQRLWLRATARINPAVSFTGDMGFQGWLNGPYVGGPNWAAVPHNAGWVRPSSRSYDALDGYTVPILRSLYMAAELPWGTLRWGRQPIAFGTGWSGYDREASRFDLLTLSVPGGPLTYMAGIGWHDPFTNSDPYDTRNANLTQRTLASTNDRLQSPAWNFLADVEYRNGAVIMGTACRYVAFNQIHAFPQGVGTIRDDMNGSFGSTFLNAFVTVGNGGGNAGGNVLPIYGNPLLWQQTIYGSYTTGRCWFNLEYAYQYLLVRRSGGRPISGWPSRWMGELGTTCGPARFSLAGFASSGHDVKGGVLDVASSNGQTGGTTQAGDTWNQWIPLNTGRSAIDPYQWLIGYYGGGNNGYDLVGEPTYSDMLLFGARWDYALAANMNLWCSGAYAKRASNTSAYWGQYTGGLLPVPVRGANVPNNNLGYEIDLGLQWKLLENLGLNTKLAVWQPGDWFKHAYIDYSSLNTITDPVSNTSVQINPDRKIDPIFGFQMVLSIDF